MASLRSVCRKENAILLFSLFQSIAESIKKDSKKGHARSGSNASSTTGHSRSGSTVSTTSQEVADINSNGQTLESSMKEIDISSG